MEPLVHFVVPFTALLLFSVEFRKALPVSLLALLPDVDAVFLVHRSVSHSVVVMLIVAAPFVLLTYKVKTGLRGYAFLALMAVLSHSILDVFAGYTPILWPLCGYSVWVQAGLMTHFGSSPSLIPTVQLLTKPIAFEQLRSLDAPLVTGEGLIESVVLLSPVLLRTFRTLWQLVKHRWS